MKLDVCIIQKLIGLTDFTLDPSNVLTFMHTEKYSRCTVLNKVAIDSI